MPPGQNFFVYFTNQMYTSSMEQMKHLDAHAI